MTETSQTANVLEPTTDRANGRAGPRGSPSPLAGRLVGRTIPNMLVVLALAGLAVWGHSTRWKLPRFAELSGQTGADKDDWCKEHCVPESQCIECNPGLLPRGKTYGWCKVHGVHECPLEHPDVAQLPSPRQITRKGLERAQRALAFTDRPANNSKYKLHLRRIQFASEQAIARAGIKVEAAWRKPELVEGIAANGEITYDQTRVANLSVPVSGKISYVLKEVGQPVQENDVLALVDAAEVGKAKAEFLQTLALLDLRDRTFESLREANREGGVPAASLQQAETALREVKIRLVAAQQALGNFGLPVRTEDFNRLSPAEAGQRVQFLGLPKALADGLKTKTTTANLIPVKAPFAGVVVARKVVAGEQAGASKILFVIADTRRMWLTLQVRQEDAPRLRAHDSSTGKSGQTVEFRPAGFDQDVSGEVVWVSTAVDQKTRTVQVRANLPNRDGQLRDGTFGSGRIILRQEKKAVVVPNEAVQWVSDSHVVFVRDKNYEDKGAFKVFHVRTVRPGARDGKVTEIIAGVLPGEMVVTKGSGLLRSELLKNNLGEG